MKALKILKELYTTIDNLGLGNTTTYYDENFFIQLEEAIKELEEVLHRIEKLEK